jgi:hypothetical protein
MTSPRTPIDVPVRAIAPAAALEVDDEARLSVAPVFRIEVLGARDGVREPVVDGRDVERTGIELLVIGSSVHVPS